MTGPNYKANVQLLAAATELLAAAEQTAEQVQHAHGCGWWSIPIAELQTELGMAACNCHLHDTREAIRKAKGE